MERMAGRRVCEHCGASYHLVAVPPKQEGVCDSCGGKLIRRKDDDPEIVHSRLDIYHQQTKPLIDFYAARGTLDTVSDQNTVAEYTAAILSAMGIESTK
jgi:adenylate kinase